MKKLLAIIFMISSMSSFSQINLPYYDSQIVHWGFTFGANYSGYTIFKNQTFVDSNYYVAIEGKQGAGIFLGPIINIKLFKYLDARFLINISFTERAVNYYFLKDNKAVLNTIKIPSSYVELPFLLKYKAKRINNFAPYLIIGVNSKYDVATYRKIDYELPHLKIAPFDFQMDIGTGFDFYLPYFKFSIELKYGNGFNNILDPEQTIYAKPIDAIKTNCFYLSFHFEG